MKKGKNYCSSIPGGAVIGVYWMEKKSIYTDVFYLANPVRLFYKRYMNDNSSLKPNREYVSAKWLENRIQVDLNGKLTF